MDKEAFFSGYCRAVDGSRTVCAELTDGEMNADCNYGCCPYEAECTIAKNIREMTEE